MKILVKGNFGIKKTGIGRVVENLLIQLSQIDHTNEYFIFVNDDYLNEYKIDHPNFHILSNGVPSTDMIRNHIWTQIGMYRQIKKLNIDVLILPGITMYVRKKCSTIYFQHDLIEYYIPNQKWYKLLFRKLIFPMAIKLADDIICVSENTKNDVVKFFNPPIEKLKVIYNGVSDIDFVKLNKEESDINLFEQYSINFKFILYVGTLTHPQKNLIRLIRAYKRIKETGYLGKLVLVGNPGKDSNLIFNEIEKCNLNNDVVRYGYVPDKDLKYFYNSADLFAFPSIYEGFGLPVIEAMKCGCPVVTSNTSSLGEIAEGSALTVNPESEEQIFEGILKILNDETLRKELIEKGYNRSKDFTWSNSAINLLKIINQLKSHQ